MRFYVSVFERFICGFDYQVFFALVPVLAELRASHSDDRYPVAEIFHDTPPDRIFEAVYSKLAVRVNALRWNGWLCHILAAGFQSSFISINNSKAEKIMSDMKVNRRDFVKLAVGAGLAASTLGSTSSVSGNVIGANGNIQYGLIGERGG